MDLEKMDGPSYENPEEQRKVTGGRRRASEQATSALSFLHDMVIAIVFVLLALFLLFRVVVVSGPSMNNTLMDGDYLLLINGILFDKPEQGDIIVASKDDFRQGEPIIKRVIATEGQTVRIDYTSGTVYVDEVPLKEAYVRTPTNLDEGMKNPTIVDKGCIFVMGDNRNDSMDSRDPSIGQIDCREVLGKVIFLLYPGTNKGNVNRDFRRIGVLS